MEIDNAIWAGEWPQRWREVGYAHVGDGQSHAHPGKDFVWQPRWRCRDLPAQEHALGFAKTESERGNTFPTVWCQRRSALSSVGEGGCSGLCPACITARLLPLPSPAPDSCLLPLRVYPSEIAFALNSITGSAPETPTCNKVWKHN